MNLLAEDAILSRDCWFIATQSC